MKFEKLNDNKIKVFFTLNDMLLNNISSDDFFTDASISQQLLHSILNNAEKEMGFKSDDSKLLVEAIKHSEGGIVFTITKICECGDLDVYLNLIFKFRDFDDFLSLCTYLKNMKSIDLKDYHELFSLILYNNTYHLSISNISLLPDSLLNVLDEFADSVLCSSSLECLISEYGKIIFNKNAIDEGIKMI